MSHAIINILDQVTTNTEIRIGTTRGYFISTAQVHAIQAELGNSHIRSGANTPTPLEEAQHKLLDLVAHHREILADIENAPKDRRSALNELLQRANSQIATQRRIIKKLTE